MATMARFLLIPAFYFTAKYGDQGWMIVLMSFLGLTNGYLTVCVLTTAPKCYKASFDKWNYVGLLELGHCLTSSRVLYFQAPEQNALGNLLVLFLLGGIFSGVALDWLWIIGNKKFWELCICLNQPQTWSNRTQRRNTIFTGPSVSLCILDDGSLGT